MARPGRALAPARLGGVRLKAYRKQPLLDDGTSYKIQPGPGARGAKASSD